MGKPKNVGGELEIIPVYLHYSRQREETKKETLGLLKQIESQHGIHDLSKMKDTNDIIQAVKHIPKDV